MNRDCSFMLKQKKHCLRMHFKISNKSFCAQKREWMFQQRRVGFSLFKKIIYGEVIYGEVTAEGFKQVTNVENERNVCPKVSTLWGQSSSCSQAARKQHGYSASHWRLSVQAPSRSHAWSTFLLIFKGGKNIRGFGVITSGWGTFHGLILLHARSQVL